MKKMGNKGFTLVELIIVIAILAIIMLIAIPNFSGIQQRMQVRADKATAAQIGKAVRIWYAEKTSDKQDVSGNTAGQIGTYGEVGADFVNYNTLDEIGNYISTGNVPTSLTDKDTKAKVATQYYSVILNSRDEAAKIVVAIEGTGNLMPDTLTESILKGTDDKGTPSTDDDVDMMYNGVGAGIAYIEP